MTKIKKNKFRSEDMHMVAHAAQEYQVTLTDTSDDGDAPDSGLDAHESMSAQARDAWSTACGTWCGRFIAKVEADERFWEGFWSDYREGVQHYSDWRSCLGYDLFLTSDGHGAGFWTRDHKTGDGEMTLEILEDIAQSFGEMRSFLDF